MNSNPVKSPVHKNNSIPVLLRLKGAVCAVRAMVHGKHPCCCVNEQQ